MPALPQAYLCIYGVQMLIDQIDLAEKPATDKTMFFAKQNVKRVLLCLHGFETRNIHDCVEFKKYFDDVNSNPSYELDLFTFYEWGEPKSYKHKMFYEKCRAEVQKYYDKGYVVYILAYSFSASIGAKLCVEFPKIEKLVLVAPTTYLIRTKLLINYLKIACKQVKFKLKYKEKANKVLIRTKNNGLIKLFFAMTGTILSYRKYLKKLDGKVLMIKGSEDEFSINNTFSYVSYKAKNAVTISKVYPGYNHIMFMERDKAICAYKDVLYFIFHIENLDSDILEENDQK